MKISLGATWKIAGGGFVVAWDQRDNLVEWHFYHSMSDIVNDDYYDCQYWRSDQICNYHSIRGV